jgi:hypothetical protein
MIRSVLLRLIAGGLVGESEVYGHIFIAYTPLPCSVPVLPCFGVLARIMQANVVKICKDVQVVLGAFPRSISHEVNSTNPFGLRRRFHACNRTSTSTAWLRTAAPDTNLRGGWDCHCGAPLMFSRLRTYHNPAFYVVLGHCFDLLSGVLANIISRLASFNCVTCQAQTWFSHLHCITAAFLSFNKH